MDPEVNKSILDMVMESSPVVQAVLIALIVLSVWSWAITVAKIFQFRKAKADSNEFSSLFWETRNLARVDDSSRRLSSSPLAQVFMAGYKELSHLLQESAKGSATPPGHSDLESVERALKRAEMEESVKLEQGNTFLASVASSAPFIGLFGTVWGIMNAFHGLSSAKSTTIQAVAPGISEALVATAIGLAAAIPAAVAFNYFVVGARRFRDSMDRFSSDFLTIAKRDILG